MKGLFPGYTSKIENHRELWDTALFVFDTNVLLNAYRYKQAARDALLSTIRALGNRAWIPYHVALEYHRGRLKVIADQNSQFSRVQEALEEAIQRVHAITEGLDSRHSSIDCSDFNKEIDAATKKFIELLSEKSRNQQGLRDTDPTLIELETIFESKVGEEPSLERLAKLNKDAETRQAKQIPPGYKDAIKKDSGFQHNEKWYVSAFGDYYLWSQTLEHCSDNEVKCLIIVTDDMKEDWVHRVSGQTIGPKPELIEEAKRYGVNSLLLYNSTTFVGYAKEYLHSTEITNDIVDEISQINDIDDLAGAVRWPHARKCTLRTRAISFLTSAGYVIRHAGNSGWFKAENGKSQVTVWTIERMGMLEMMSSLNLILAFAIKESADLDPYNPTFIFVGTTKKTYSKLLKLHAAFMDSVKRAEQSNVLVAFVEHDSHGLDEPLIYLKAEDF
ncbi:PIN domain-containing protein [Xanthomonas arboricola]|uniref:PIN-like domain-containing protein n=1 Tax=Xanthomonas arboricola TaxID=56448 RepID=UPI0039F557AE